MLASLPFVPIDRQVEAAGQAALPDRGHGSALFADISGFTAMTEALVAHYGPLRGAERLGSQLEAIYTPLIHEVHARRGAVIGFSGDAITCWFAAAAGERPEQRAVAAARAMQTAMHAFHELRIGPRAVTLAVKIAVTSGPARRFVVGDPRVQRIDALAGATLVRLAAAEQLAEPGDVLVDAATADALDGASLGDWRDGAGARVQPVTALDGVDPISPWTVDTDGLDPAWVRSWAHAPVAERYASGADFNADFRPAAALFLSFGGIDYDGDNAAGVRLDAFVRSVQARLDDYGGSLIQLTIGDKGSYLYAAFGAPVAIDREAERAVEAARVLLGERSGDVSDIRIGLAHGRMFAGAYGSASRQTYGVLGPKTNLSARFMKKAPAGTILCDDAIVRGARRRWTFRPGAALELKGIAEPVVPFEPEGRRDATLDATSPTALVGRDADLLAVARTIEEAEAGTYGAIAVEGEAGIGKSRLLSTAVERASRRGLHVHQGAGRSEARGVPYAAWRELLASVLGIDPATATLDDDNAASAREAIKARVATLAPDEARWVPLLDDILDIGLEQSELTADLDPGLRRDNVRQLVIAMLVTEAKDAPLVLLLDDAHWVDSVSWELTRDVARALREQGARACLLLGHRPLEDGNLAEAPLRDLAQTDGLVTHPLGALGDAGLRQLVAERLDVEREDVPPALSDLVVERAGGNPLFAEELLESLRETGALRATSVDGVRRIVFTAPNRDDGASGSLPPTLHGLVLMRLDRLPNARQRVLKVASAVGRLFAERPLAASLESLHAGATDALPDDLEALIDRRMIVSETDTPESTFLFRHVLTHEAVYESLLYAQRRRIHRILAEWFEAAYRDRLEGLESTLSLHYLRAADGSDDPALLDKAVRYTSAAGGRSDRLGAYPEAIAAFQAALGLLQPGEEHALARSTLLVSLAETLERTGEFDAADTLLGEALDLADGIGNDVVAATALTARAMVQTRLGDFDAARDAADASLERSERAGDAVAQSSAHSRLGIVAFYQGDLPGATKHFERSYELRRMAGSRDSLPGCLNSLGLAAFHGGDPEKARAWFEEGIEIARELGDRNATSHMLSNLGLIAEGEGDFEKARDLYGEALDLQLEIGARQGAALSILNLGDACASLELVADATAHYRDGLARARELDAVPLALIALRGLAWSEREHGRFERAAELLGLVLVHPACGSELEGQAQEVLEGVRSHLAPSALERALRAGEALELDEVAASLLASPPAGARDARRASGTA